MTRYIPIARITRDDARNHDHMHSLAHDLVRYIRNHAAANPGADRDYWTGRVDEVTAGIARLRERTNTGIQRSCPW